MIKLFLIYPIFTGFCFIALSPVLSSRLNCIWQRGTRRILEAQLNKVFNMRARHVAYSKPYSFWNLAQLPTRIRELLRRAAYTLQFHLVSNSAEYTYALRPRSRTWKHVTTYYVNKAVNGVQGCRWVFLHDDRRRSSICGPRRQVGI